jgi:XisI protein
MDSLENYRNIILQILQDHVKFATGASSPSGDYEYEIIADRDADHYLLMSQGWEVRRRVHSCIMHIDIIGDKIWIQHDGTEYGIAEKLLSAGVPKNKIVLGFKSPTLRKYTEFAAA